MRIETLTLDRFKGISGTFSLPQLLMLLGRNGAGKTAIIEAIRFTANGDCSLGKSNEAVAKLVSPQGGGVSVAMDDGYFWSREIVIDAHSTKVSQRITIGGEQQKSLTDAKVAIAEHVGGTAEMFDLGEFTRKGPDLKRQYVLGLCSRYANVDVGDIPRQVCIAYLSDRLGEGTVKTMIDTGAELNAIAGKLQDPESHLFLDVAIPKIHEVMTGDPASAIAAGLDRCGGLLKESRRSHDEGRQASRALAERKAGLQTIAKSAQQIDEEIEQARQRLGECLEDIGSASVRAASIEAEQRKIDQCTDGIGKSQAELADHESYDVPPLTDADKLDSDAEHIERENPLPNRGDANALQVAYDEAAEAFEQARQAREIAESRHGDEMRLVQRLDGDIDKSKSDPWMKAFGLWCEISWNKIPEIRSQKYAEELGLLLKEQASCDRLAELQKNYESSTKSASELHNKWFELVEPEAEAAERLKEAREARDNAESAYQDRMASHAPLMEQAEQLRDKARYIREQHKARDGAMKLLRQRIEQLTSERVQAEGRRNDLQSHGAVSVDGLREQESLIREEIKNLESEKKLRQSAQEIDKQLTACQADAERAGVLFDVYKGIGAALKTVRETLMGTLVRPLIDRIDEMLSETNPGRRCFCELENAKGTAAFELGWIDGEKRRTLAAMSGGEAALFHWALLYALVSLSDVPYRCLMIEAAEMDEHTLQTACKALSAAQAHIDQVIVATCHATMETQIGEFEVIEVGSEVMA